MNVHLNKETRAKLNLAALKALSGCKDQDAVQAFADVISYNTGELSEAFTLSDALADFVFKNTGECGKYLQVLLVELSIAAGSQQAAIAALRLNGFTPIDNGDAWTNSPNGGRGFAVSIPECFFSDYLRHWANLN